jgi:hypothetical protein
MFDSDRDRLIEELYSEMLERKMRESGEAYGQMYGFCGCTRNKVAQQAAATRVATAHDASGKITVGLFQKAATNPQQHFTNFPIEVDSDMVVIGGGGRGDETIGALLTASFPCDDWTAWLVSLKDHDDPNPHYLVGFALGMKIEGMSRNELLNNIEVFQEEVDPSPHPEVTASIPEDFILLGGGFNVLWRGEGNLATASFPTASGAWTVRSKDHELADPSSLRAYAIGIRRQLPVGIIKQIVECTSSSLVAHPRSTAVLPNGFVITGGGAEVHWKGTGNLLWHLEPHVGGFTAASKDHRISDPSSITTYTLGIQLR